MTDSEQIVLDRGSRKLYTQLIRDEGIDYLKIKSRIYVHSKKSLDGKDMSAYWNEDVITINREEFANLVDYVKNKEFKDIRKKLKEMRETISDMEDKLVLHKW